MEAPKGPGNVVSFVAGMGLFGGQNKKPGGDLLSRGPKAPVPSALAGSDQPLRTPRPWWRARRSKSQNGLGPTNPKLGGEHRVSQELQVVAPWQTKVESVSRCDLRSQVQHLHYLLRFDLFTSVPVKPYFFPRQSSFIGTSTSDIKQNPARTAIDRYTAGSPEIAARTAVAA
jgi:hypothetical protein